MSRMRSGTDAANPGARRSGARGRSFRRIAVIGRAGSGKTTTALRLGEALDLEVVHLDQVYWTRDWQPVPDHEFEARHESAISQEAWILDGGYMSRPSFADRVRRADLVVITEASLARCVVRVLRRTIAHRDRRRADRPYGAREAFSLTFLIWMLRWTRVHRNLRAEIAAIDAAKPVALVRSASDLDAVLSG